MRPLILFLVASIAYSCEKIEVDTIDNLNNGKVYVIGHAGEGFSSHINHYPFNSAGSISRALKFHRADGVEVDLQMSNDHQSILYHDNYLDTKTTCSGSVYELSQAELKSCRYSAGIYPSLMMSEYLIDLNTAFSICKEMPDPKPIVFIDIKINPTNLNLDMKVFKDSLVSLLKKSSANYPHEKIHFIANDSKFLTALKKQVPRALFHIEAGGARQLIEEAIANDLDGIVLTEDDMEAVDSETAHRNGLYVSIFGVRSLDDIDDALELNPDFIHTDNIPLTQSVLRSL